jgi:hypothetical protein
MFGDDGWDSSRVEVQEQNLDAWMTRARGARLVAIECGAGTAVPSVRHFNEHLLRVSPGLLLLRINLREPEVPEGHLGLPLGALAALRAIEACR